jgi:hypothetical protein
MKNNYRFTIPVLILILAVFTSGHVVISDTIGIRLPLQLLMCILICLFLALSMQKKINKNGSIVLLATIPSILGELFIRGNVNDLLGYFFLIILVFIVLLMSYEEIINFLISLNFINAFFAALAIFAFLLAILLKGALFWDLLARPIYYSSSFLEGNVGIWSLFGQADTWYEYQGVKFMRMAGHLQQASLIPAYFLLPLSMYLAFFSKYKIKIIFLIILLSLVSMGGNVIVALIMSLVIYNFSNYVPRYVLIAFPFVVLIIFLSTITFVVSDFYDLTFLKENARSVGINFQNSYLGEDSIINNRLSSAVGRLTLIGFQVHGFFDFFPFPSNESLVNLTIGGNLMTNSLRGGLLGSIFSIFMYFVLFCGISKNIIKYKSSNKAKKFGLSLMYALVFQSFVYNDFGFSTYYGYFMFSIIIILLFTAKNNTNKNQRTSTLKI